MTVEEIVNSKFVFRLPFKKEELRYFLENETIFKRQKQLKIDQFVKNFFPENMRSRALAQGGKLDSDSSDSDAELTGHPASHTRQSSENISPVRRGSISNDGTSIGGTTMFSGSIRSTQMADSVKKLDTELKKKLSNNFGSVRKAFLALDENHKGYISAE